MTFIKRNANLRYSDDWSKNVAPHVNEKKESFPVEEDGKVVGWQIKDREEEHGG